MTRPHTIALRSLASLLLVLAACAPGVDVAVEPASPTAAAPPAPSAAPPAAAERPIPNADLVIGFSTNRDLAEADAAATILAQALEDALTLSVAVHRLETDAQTLDALRTGSVQAAFLTPASVVRSIDGSQATPVLVALRDGTSGSRGEFYVRCDGGASTLSDLRGTRFAFVAPASTLGHHAPHVTLLRAGIDPERDLQAVFAGNHSAVLQAIYDGEVDAGVTFEGGIEILASARPDARDLLCSLGYTVSIPNDALVVSANLGGDARARLVDALQQVLEQHTPRSALVTIIGGDGLLETTSDDAYDVLREIAAAF